MFKQVSDEFFIKTPSKKFRKFEGDPVNIKGFEKFDFFIFGEVGHWRISEAKTGDAVITYNGSKAAAVREAAVEIKRSLKKEVEEFVSLFGIDKSEAYKMALNDHIKKTVKAEGLSPRYKEEV